MLPEYSTAQSFITQEYPEYAYQTKIRYQHAFFNHLLQKEVSSGVYNVSATIPFNHTLAAAVNIPVMANYTVSNEKNVMVGNIELGIQLRNPKWKDRASVYSMGFVIPFTSQNPENRIHISDDFNTLPELACITDFTNCHWYIPGMWAATASYAYHLQHNHFQFMVLANPGFMIRKIYKGQTSPLYFFFHSKLKGVYGIGAFNIVTELAHSAYLGKRNEYYYGTRNESNVVINGIVFFTGTLGITYTYKCLQPGVFYQINMNQEINQYATHIVGIQLRFSINKKEKYLKTKDSEY